MKIMLCYAVTIKMNLSRGIWALPSIFKLGETIISFHCSTIMLGTWDGVRFLLEGKLRAVPGLAHCCFYSSVMTWFPGLGAVQAWWEGQLLSPEHVAPSPYRHKNAFDSRHCQSNPWIEWDVSHVPNQAYVKISMGFGPYEHGPRVKT